MERLDLNISETGCSQLSVHDIRVQKDISQNINTDCRPHDGMYYLPYLLDTTQGFVNVLQLSPIYSIVTSFVYTKRSCQISPIIAQNEDVYHFFETK